MWLSGITLKLPLLKRLFTGGLLLILVGLSILFGLPNFSGNGWIDKLAAQTTVIKPPPEKISFYGRVVNKTTGRPVRVEQLSLIQLSEGMQTVETISRAGPQFRFAAVERPTTPYLIRAIYRGGSYSSLIPPTERFIDRRQTIIVYDPGAANKDMEITSAMWVTKREKGLSIEKVFIMANRSSPPRSFDASGLYFFLPQAAKQLSARIFYKQFPLPLQLEKGESGYSLKHFIRPGSSELRLQYELADLRFEDRLLIEAQQANIRPFRLLFWRPKGAKPVISGGETKTIHIPRLGEALQVNYSSTSRLDYDFRRGAILIERPLQSDSNPLFDSPWKTAVALLLAATGLSSLLAMLAGRVGYRRNRLT